MKKILYLFLSVNLLLSSCDVLDMSPLDKISEDNVWQDQALIETYVNAAYHALPNGFKNEVLGSACDEAYNIHNSGSFRTILRGELTADNVKDISWTLNYWNSAYSNIRNINIFFSRIDEAPVDEAFRQRVKGEMTFIRAFIYANLIARYGGVPVIDKIFALSEDYTVSQSPYDECVQFIVSELDKAIALLPDKQPDSELGRASADACRALKSRVLLYAASPLVNINNDKSKWQAAADAAKELLDTRYQLQDDYQTVFLKDNNEIILARYFSQSGGDNGSDFHLFHGRNGSYGWGAENPSQQAVNAFEMINGEFPYLENGTVNPQSGYDPNNPYKDRDPRLHATILYDGSVWMGRETETYRGGLDSPESLIQSWNASLTGYFLKKFLQEDVPPTGSNTRPTSPWLFFRYGEILLNYAEAMFEIGDENTAREYLNNIRSRQSVQMPPVPSSVTGEQLRKRIQHERRIELIFENQRFFDVRRWLIAMDTENVNLTGINIEKADNGTKTYSYDRPVLERSFLQQHYWIPIPRVEIDKSLGSLKQSPNYK